MWTWHVQIGERLVIWCRNREPLRWLQFPSLLLVRLPWNLTPRKVKRETTRSPATCCPPVHQLGKDDHAFLPAPSTRPAHPSPTQPISAVNLPDPVVGPAYLQLIWAVHFVNKPTGPGGDLTMGPTPPAHRDRQLGREDQSGPHQMLLYSHLSVSIRTECGDPRVCALESIPAWFVVTL